MSTRVESSETKPIHVLMEESDPVQRAHAHLSLGEGALERSDEANAKRHFQQALDLAPEDDLVRSTTGSARLRTVVGSSRGWWSGWWN